MREPASTTAELRRNAVAALWVLAAISLGAFLVVALLH
jgi:hypothetical protein